MYCFQSVLGLSFSLKSRHIKCVLDTPTFYIPFRRSGKGYGIDKDITARIKVTIRVRRLYVQYPLYPDPSVIKTIEK